MRQAGLATVMGVAVLLGAAASYAQVRYLDDNGVTHWVQTPEQIPPQYRGRETTPGLPEIQTESPQAGGLSERCKRELLTAGERQRERWQRYGQKTDLFLSPECNQEVLRNAGVAPSKLSDACEQQFRFASDLKKKAWQEYGRRDPLRKYLTPACAEEITKRYPKTDLDE